MGVTNGKFQITLIIKEFVETPDSIELQPIADYQESCSGWKNAKETIVYFTKRIETKLNGEHDAET